MILSIKIQQKCTVVIFKASLFVCVCVCVCICVCVCVWFACLCVCVCVCVCLVCLFVCLFVCVVGGEGECLHIRYRLNLRCFLHFMQRKIDQNMNFAHLNATIECDEIHQWKWVSLICLQSAETALHVAARYGHAQVVDFLCSANANINVIDSVSTTWTGLVGQLSSAAEPLCWGGTLCVELPSHNHSVLSDGQAAALWLKGNCGPLISGGFVMFTCW